jgi:putative transposon-encoded protein
MRCGDLQKAKVLNSEISNGYPMKKVPLQAQTHLELDGIQGFIIRKVTKFGNSAKVDCPKEYLGRTVYLVIV